MKKILVSMIIPLTTVQGFAQDNLITDNKSNTVEPDTMAHIGEIILPILFISFLIFMLTLLVRHFLDFRLKNKMIDKGMSEQLSTYLFNKNDQERDIIKLAILFCGIGAGLIITHLTRPLNLHSLAIMAICIGLSYFAYFLYLRKQDK